MKLLFVNRFSFSDFFVIFYVLIDLYDFINFCKLISIHDFINFYESASAHNFIIFYKPIRAHDFTSFYDLMTSHKLIKNTKKSALRQINISYLQLNYHIESLPALDI
ncbi:MAG: hypothetical protein E7F47_00620 [Peptoniphilus harei]|nr:hypothetical protein [Peptoniphilus harei]